MIGTDVQNTTLPNKGPGKSAPMKGNPMEKDFKRQMIKQLIIDKMKGQG